MTEDEWILHGVDAIQPGDVIGIMLADGTIRQCLVTVRTDPDEHTINLQVLDDPEGGPDARC
jgi:hypothetical protein